MAFDPARPNIARAYDYMLGGKDHFAPDRELAERILAIYPGARQMARENRRFLLRALHYVLVHGCRPSTWIWGPGCPHPRPCMKSSAATAPAPASATWTTTRL